MDYWIKRSIQRTAEYESRAVFGFAEVAALHQQALRNIQQDLTKVYVKFGQETGLDKRLLNLLMDAEDIAEFRRQLAYIANLLGVSPSELYSFSSIRRFTRLEALKQQIEWNCIALATGEDQISEKMYREIASRMYNGTATDIRKIAGLPTTFATTSSKWIEVILNRKWEGSNYSGRIWNNTNELARRIQDVLAGGMTSGWGVDKMDRQLREAFDVARYKSLRLIRTESSFVANQAKTIVYKDLGVVEYEYVAVLDNRTSEICTELDGQVFKVEDARTGVNYPPMHPNCRSTTVPVPPGIKGGIDVVVGRWSGELKGQFDQAIFEGDADTVKRLLPYVPEDYRRIFASNIEKALRGEGRF